MPQALDRALQILRDGDAVTRQRARGYAILFLGAVAAALVFLALTAHGPNDYQNRPLGTDFSDVYAAGTLAREDAPADAYVPAKHYRAEQAIFGPATPFYGWHYPPFFLLVAHGLAALPYLPALILWQGLTLALYLLAMRTLLRHGPVPQTARDPVWMLCALAFPAVFLNLVHGQNGFATTALMAGALALLDKRAWTAGVLFGLLAYKPQFGMLIPLVLAASGRWKTFLAATATVAVLAVLATLAFGTGIWGAFLTSLPFTRTVVLEDGGTGFHKLQSMFAAVRLLGGPVSVAYAAQAAVTVSVAAGLAWLWRTDASLALKGAGLCLGVLLATPYALDYDMMALAPAIALIAAEGLKRGFRPYEKAVLAALWIAPVVTRGVAQVTHVPLGLLVMMLCFALVLRRARTERTAETPV
jgi:alpha-1,2-mannosyltransferase